LQDAGIDPAPRPVGPTWRQFLTAQAVLAVEEGTRGVDDDQTVVEVGVDALQPGQITPACPVRAAVIVRTAAQSPGSSVRWLRSSGWRSPWPTDQGALPGTVDPTGGLEINELIRSGQPSAATGALADYLDAWSTQ
jgi:hypothetical protein